MNCYYCGLKMKTANDKKSDFYKLLKIKKGEPRSKKLYRYAEISDEHLVKKSDGGTNKKSNIVKAHRWCNSSRGDKTPQEHKEFINYLLRTELHPLISLKETHETPCRNISK